MRSPTLAKPWLSASKTVRRGRAWVCIVRVQRFDEGAVRSCPFGASRDGVPQYRLHGPEVSELRPDVLEMRGSYGTHLRARALPLVGELKQLADFVE
jgi:hypothetical protein